MRSKYEIKAQKELEKEGWLVDNKAGMGRFAKNRDFFNLFDLIAIKKNYPVRWISIKGHRSNQRKHKEAIKKFPLLTGINIKELWRWPKNKKKKQWIKIIIP